MNNKQNNKILYCIVLTARTAALSFFQNPAHDRESNPHAILICIWFFSPLKLYKGCGLDSRIYGIKHHEPIELCSSVLNTHRSQNDGLWHPRGSVLVPHFKRSLSPLSDINGCEEWLMNGRKILLLFIVEGNIHAAILFFFCTRLEDTSHEPGLRDVISPCHVTRRWKIHACLVDRQT